MGVLTNTPMESFPHEALIANLRPPKGYPLHGRSYGIHNKKGKKAAAHIATAGFPGTGTPGASLEF